MKRYTPRLASITLLSALAAGSMGCEIIAKVDRSQIDQGCEDTNGEGCQKDACGDGVLATKEGCDDGNTTGSDGCAADCTVEAGYTCTGAPSACADVDECAGGTAGCDTNATCTNTPGSATCSCNAGYEGDGKTCTNVDECATNADDCDSNATCTDTDGSFSCACNAGFMGDGKTCADVDECADGSATCDANATCTDTPGSFSCACNAGYSGDGKACANIDECAANTDDCDSNATCTDTPGSFSCACNAGFTGDGKTCADVDECLVNNGGCDPHATCTNTPGSRTCACDATYLGDGFSCKALQVSSVVSPAGMDCQVVPNVIGNNVSFGAANEVYVGMLCLSAPDTRTAYIAKSTNGGASFGPAAPIGTLPTGPNEMRLDIATGPGVIYAASSSDTDTLTFTRSTDGGATWDTAATLLPGSSSYPTGSIAVRGSSVYLSVIGAAGVSVFRNDNLGAGAFSQTDVPASVVVHSLLADPGSSTLYLVGDFAVVGAKDLWVSADSGQTFTQGPPPPDVVFGSWVLADGWLNGVSTYAVNDMARISQADLTMQTSLSGLPAVAASQQFARDISARPNGDIAVVTGVDPGPALHLALLPKGAASFVDLGELAPRGVFPQIEMNPGAEEAVLVYNRTRADGTSEVVAVRQPFAPIDECAAGVGSCPANTTCVDTPAHYTCDCGPGYWYDGAACVDVDECDTGAAGCDSNATCANTPGSFTCTCNAGYTGDGQTCTDIDECATNTDDCGGSEVCTNITASFRCSTQVLTDTPEFFDAPGCKTYAAGTYAFTRTDPGQNVYFSQNAGDMSAQPYLDEMALISVTSPTGVVVGLNVVRWSTTCTDPSATTINIGGGSALDITSLFGSEVGTFQVHVEVRNEGPPGAWSNAFIVR